MASDRPPASRATIFSPHGQRNRRPSLVAAFLRDFYFCVPSEMIAGICGDQAHVRYWHLAARVVITAALVQVKSGRSVSVSRALRSIGVAYACDGLRPFDAASPCPLTLMTCACERCAGTIEGVSMGFSCRFDIPSNCAFSSIARDR